MSKYLIEGTYTAEGARGLLKQGGTSRRAQIEKMLADLGGSLEAFYWAFGDIDFYIIADLPDKQRQVITYRYLGGLSYARIVGLVGGTEAAARRAASDGLKSLREKEIR